MKKSKGFTLIELLSVIVILGIILVIAVPNIINLINKARIDAYERQKDIIIDAAQKYILQHGDILTWTNGTTTIHLNDLQDANLIDNPLKDPRGGEFNNSEDGTKIVVTKNNNQYSYDLTAITGDDTTPPVITLLGNSSIDINQGDTYTDAGATATDDTDGDITSKIVITDNIDTGIVGTYTITYNVTDKAGNAATPVTRTVNVISNGDVNAPVLVTGMIPVYYDEGAGSWKKADSTNENNSWYDYTKQQWANAVTVTTTNRATYQSAAVGTTIPMTNINTMFVWIPRYKYRIPSGTEARQIDVVFETKTTPKSIGDAITTYYTHPAFTLGTDELFGIWVGKFETTGTITALTIKPDLSSIRSQSVKAMYDSVKTYMQGSSTYGFTNDNDTHMMKNTEWGAVAYLTQSIYGKYGNSSYIGINKEIYLNNSSGYYTGRSSGTIGGSGIVTPTYEYIASGYYNYDGKCALINSALPAPCNSGSVGQVLTDKTLAYGASTTGTIYGIYDMSGSAWEYLMGVYKPTTLSGIRDCSGYSNSYAPPIACPTTAPYDSYYENLTIDNKYYNVYLTTTTLGAIIGDATAETSGWYGDYTSFVSEIKPWSIGGGSFANGASAGAFSYGGGNGVPIGSNSFRIVLSPNS